MSEKAAKIEFERKYEDGTTRLVVKYVADTDERWRVKIKSGEDEAWFTTADIEWVRETLARILAEVPNPDPSPAP